MSINDFSDASLTHEKRRVKRQLEREYGLPVGACDLVDNDLIRLLVWRDKKADPGPLTEVQRHAYMAQFFNEIFHKKRAKGELIFRDAREAESFLRDCGFSTTSHPSRYEKSTISAFILQSGLITRIIAKNTLTGEILDNRKHLDGS